MEPSNEWNVNDNTKYCLQKMNGYQVTTIAVHHYNREMAHEEIGCRINLPCGIYEPFGCE